MQQEIFFLKAESYREMFGFSLPKTADVSIKYMEGVKWYIHWPKCPDGEDILYSHLSSKGEALKILKKHEGWNLIEP